MEVTETVTQNGVALLHLKADHVDASPGKGLDGDGGGEAEDAGDLLCRRQVGVDDHVQPDLPLQHIRIPPVVRVAHPGHGVPCTQTLGDQAAHQVRLVHAGDGNDQIGAADTCLHQHADGSAVSVEAHGVQCAVRPAQMLRLVVHQRDVMLFLCQLLGDGIAHLAAAYDNDPHISSFAPPARFSSSSAAENSAPSISTCPDIYSHRSTTITVAIEPYSTE